MRLRRLNQGLHFEHEALNGLVVVGGGELNEGGVEAGIHVGAELGGHVLWGAEHGAVRFGDFVVRIAGKP